MCVISKDARYFTGTLESYDVNTNLLLSDCNEIIVGSDIKEDPTQVIPLGLFFIRGDNVVCCGLKDDLQEISWENVTGRPLKTTYNSV